MAERTTAGRSRLHFFKSAGGVVTTLVGLVSGVLGIVFGLVPALQPDSGTAGPDERTATLVPRAMTPNVTAEQFLKETGGDTSRYGELQLRTRGSYVFLEVEARGLKGARLPLVWSTYNANANELLADPRLRNKEAAALKPDASIYRRIAKIWIPYPPASGTYFARIELRSGADILALADTKPYQLNLYVIGPPSKEPIVTLPAVIESAK